MESRFWIDLKSEFSLLLLFLLISIAFRIYEDFFDRDRKVRLDIELLDPRDPDCIVKKESLELFEFLLLGEGGEIRLLIYPSFWWSGEGFLEN